MSSPRPPDDSKPAGTPPTGGSDPSGLTPEEQQRQESRRLEQAQNEARKKALNEVYPRYKFGGSRFKQIDKTDVKKENDAKLDDAPGLASGQDDKDKNVKGPGYYQNIDTKAVVEITADGRYRPVITPPPTFEKRCVGLDAAMQLAKENGKTEVVYDIDNPKYANHKEMEYVLRSAAEKGLKVSFGSNVTKAFMEPNSSFMDYRSQSSNAWKGDLLDIERKASPIARNFANTDKGLEIKRAVFQRLIDVKKKNDDAIDAKVNAKLGATPAAKATPPAGTTPAVKATPAAKTPPSTPPASPRIR